MTMDIWIYWHILDVYGHMDIVICHMDFFVHGYVDMWICECGPYQPPGPGKPNFLVYSEQLFRSNSPLAHKFKLKSERLLLKID